MHWKCGNHSWRSMHYPGPPFKWNCSRSVRPHLQKIIRLCKLCKRFLQTLSQEYIHSTFMTLNQEVTKITSQNKEIIMWSWSFLQWLFDKLVVWHLISINTMYYIPRDYWIKTTVKGPLGITCEKLRCMKDWQFNSLRPSDPYMHQQTNRHRFR